MGQRRNSQFDTLVLPGRNLSLLACKDVASMGSDYDVDMLEMIGKQDATIILFGRG